MTTPDPVDLRALVERTFVSSLERRLAARPLTPHLARQFALEALRDAALVAVLETDGKPGADLVATLFAQAVP